jgi:transposase
MKVVRDEAYFLRGTITMLEATVEGLQYELHMRDIRLKAKDKYIAELEQRIEELKQEATAAVAGAGGSEPAALPAFVKPNVPRRRRRKPGRKVGHEAALRPPPLWIDRDQQVPLPTDRARHAICPACRCRLSRLRMRRRIVEDLVPSAVETTCYHTASGYCPRCRKRIESQAPEQPPPANLPHAQLGINALTTAAILRVRHRLPYRQIAQLLLDMPGLAVSPGGLVRQIKRLSLWLDGKYQDLIRQMRASEHVHVDETGWRIDGRNFWLWAFTNPAFTLYHIDASRGGKVPLKLLGKAFGGTVIADFYGAYDRLAGPRQRCLTHLMRDVKQTGEKDPAFADCPLSAKLLKWCKNALHLKKQRATLDESIYQRKVIRLEKQLDGLIQLTERHNKDPVPLHPDARRLCKRLKRYRAELTRFLREKQIDGTNNAAERALRPAVIMRKITGGSRSTAGAKAWATLASLLRTADQQNLGVYQATKKLIIEYWETRRR